MRELADLDALVTFEGATLGSSGWVQVDQSQIDAFADVTGDRQWIHVDAARAANGPFGATIAHGYLTLSLLPGLVAQVYRVGGVRLAVNYGLNSVRFPAPVPVGTRIRATCELATVERLQDGAKVVLRTTIECDAQSKPVCVAETVTRFYV